MTSMHLRVLGAKGGEQSRAPRVTKPQRKAQTKPRKPDVGKKRGGRTAPPPHAPAQQGADLRKNASVYAEVGSSASNVTATAAIGPRNSAAPGSAGPQAAATMGQAQQQQQQQQQQLQQLISGSLPPAHPLASRRKPEVLAPAGGWPQLRAAVECGADAVYFGLSDLNARARASNFGAEELPEIMAYLHDRGAKGYVVLNVLVFDEELGLVEQRARQMEAAGVDAVIVQDLGAVALIRRAAPNLPIHGSTQMTVTSREGALFAGSLGVSRVVVGRELSIREIGRMWAPKPAAPSIAAVPPAGHPLAETAAAEEEEVAGQEAAANGATAVAAVGAEAQQEQQQLVAEVAMPEVEAFVHGALCVSYSGQCFSSEAWGGRSANRGQCAQACRMPYGLIVNGELRDLQDMQYLLSPQDLAAVELVPELIAAGVSCFKIEGRLKGPEYVAQTTTLYRRAVDAAWAALTAASHDGAGNGSAAAAAPPESSGIEAGRVRLTPDEWLDLRQVFARGQDGGHLGLTPGFLEGPRHQELVRGRAPRHRGNFAGTVLQVGREGVKVELSCRVRRGDGVVFDQGDPQSPEEGGQIYEILTEQGGSVAEAAAGARVTLLFGRGQVALGRVRPGHLLWRNKDPALEARLRGSYEGLPAAEQRRLPVRVAVAVAAGQPLRVVLTDPQGRRGEGETSMAAVAAEGRGVGEGDVRRAVGVHLGGEGALLAAEWDLSGCDFSSGLFVPGAAIKEARRQAVAALLAARRQGRAADAAADAGSAGSAVPAGSAAAGAAAEVEEEVLPKLLAAVRHRGKSWPGKSEVRRQAVVTGLAHSVGPPTLRVLCRTRAQVDAALQVPWLQEVILDFLEVHGLREACASVRAAKRRLVVATPRVLKPGEDKLLHFYLRLGADALLLRSAGALQQLMAMGGPGAPLPGIEGTVPVLEGDFSLNAANALTADLLLRSGLARLAPTHDCNAAQIERMALTLGSPRASRLELVLHHHLPIFHTEHCVFARFLSEGNSFVDCGHPCEKNSVHLRDGAGADHLVLADQGCRNTVFNAQAQTGLPFLPQLLAAGVGAFRVELVDNPPEHVGPLLKAYREALLAGSQLVRFAAQQAHRQAQQGGSGAQQGGEDVMKGRRVRGEWEVAEAKAWELLQRLPDANGRAHGAGTGSLEVRGEKAAASMKKTAAELKAR